MYQELPKYGLAGLVGTAAHYAVMFSLLSAGANPISSTFVGALTGSIINYFVCRAWVFSVKPSITHLQIPRFAVTSIVVLVTNTALIWALTPTMTVWPSQLIATGISFLIGYLINRHWTFMTTTEDAL